MEARRVHFIGIGGYGMSGLALVLLKTGTRVSGSDARRNSRTDQLSRAGAAVHIGHDAALVVGADLVVYSTDVPADNPELTAAKAGGIKVVHRSELLAEFVNRQAGIAIAGTHGKTTTTALTALMLEAGGLEPTALIGGEVPAWGGTAKIGSGPHVVAEADESDRSFLRYFPAVAVVTNIEAEHLDHYNGRFTEVVAAFGEFLAHVREDGLIVACADEPTVLDLVQPLMGQAGRPRVILYGCSEAAAWRAYDIEPQTDGIAFSVRRGRRHFGRFELGVPGRQNVLNALASMAVADHLGVGPAPMARALKPFRGVKRRFQVITVQNGITVVDDYAHHPTEIRATLRAAKEMQVARASAGQSGRGRVLAVFQPQRYSRTQSLIQDFATAFGDADLLVLADIYAPPGDNPIPGVSSARLAELIAGHRHPPLHMISDHDAIARFLVDLAEPGDLVITMGAGNIGQAAEALAGMLGGALPSGRPPIVAPPVECYNARKL